MTTHRSLHCQAAAKRLGSISLFVLVAIGLVSACAQPPATGPRGTSAETLAEAEAPPQMGGESSPGLIHTVFFWLREDLTEEERADFVAGNRAMVAIPSVRYLYFGPPAPTEARDVVDNTYDYALILHFDDLAGQDAYQVHPMHKQMVEDHGDKWTRVVVYDSEVMN